MGAVIHQDKDMLIKGFECCLAGERHENSKCEECPYNFYQLYCREYMFEDAIKILENIK